MSIPPAFRRAIIVGAALALAVPMSVAAGDASAAAGDAGAAHASAELRDASGAVVGWASSPRMRQASST